MKTVSGKVELGASGDGSHLDPHRVGHGRGLGARDVRARDAPEVDQRAGANDCAEGTDGEIDVKTVSGTIRIVNK